jgi:hypothetical protein
MPVKHHPSDTGASRVAQVYDGRVCLGFIIGRGRDGFEAFNANDKSVGLFGTVKLAADALSEREGGR